MKQLSTGYVSCTQGTPLPTRQAVCGVPWRSMENAVSRKSNDTVMCTFVFLEGGVLGQLHKKPSVPQFMSVSTIPSAASETDRTQNDVPVKVTTDHTYLSPTPKPMQESSLEVKPASDHTYAEYSDTPTEPYGSDTAHA